MVYNLEHNQIIKLTEPKPLNKFVHVPSLLNLPQI